MRIRSLFSQLRCSSAQSIPTHSAWSLAISNRGRMGHVAAFLVVMAATVGCTVLETRMGPSENRRGTVRGNYYHLPKGIVTINAVPTTIEVAENAENASIPSVDITTALSLEPDPNARYFLEHRKSLLADDSVTIGVGEDGLLTTVNTVADDKSPAIVANAASIFSNVARLANSLAGSRAAGKPATPFTVSFDPFDADEVSRAKNKLTSLGYGLEVDIRPGLGKAPAATTTEDRVVGGVLFRPGVPIATTVTFGNSESRTLVFAPDPNSKIAFDASRAAFVKKTTDLTFTGGMLTQSKVLLPSQLAGVVAIPKQVLTTLAPLPQTLRSDTKTALETQAAIDNLTAPPTELERLNAEIELLKARQELDRLRNPE